MAYEHPPSNIGIEEPLFEDRPHIWIQWKGTDVCCDIWCDCGESTHYDGDFFYFFKCPSCGQHWEVGTHMPIYKVTPEQAGQHVKQPQKDRE